MNLPRQLARATVKQPGWLVRLVRHWRIFTGRYHSGISSCGTAWCHWIRDTKTNVTIVIAEGEYEITAGRCTRCGNNTLVVVRDTDRLCRGCLEMQS